MTFLWSRSKTCMVSAMGYSVRRMLALARLFRTSKED